MPMQRSIENLLTDVFTKLSAKISADELADFGQNEASSALRRICTHGSTSAGK